MGYFGIKRRDESIELEDEVNVLSQEGFRGRGLFADGVLVEHAIRPHYSKDADLQQHHVVVIHFEIYEEVVVLDGFHGVVLDLGHPEQLVVDAQNEAFSLVDDQQVAVPGLEDQLTADGELIGKLAGFVEVIQFGLFVYLHVVIS